MDQLDIKIPQKEVKLRVNEIRTARGFTVQTIVARMKSIYGESVSYNTILGYDRGTSKKLTIRMLGMLATVLDVPVGELFSE